MGDKSPISVNVAAFFIEKNDKKITIIIRRLKNNLNIVQYMYAIIVFVYCEIKYDKPHK